MNSLTKIVGPKSVRVLRWCCGFSDYAVWWICRYSTVFSFESAWIRYSAVLFCSQLYEIVNCLIKPALWYTQLLCFTHWQDTIISAPWRESLWIPSADLFWKQAWPHYQLMCFVHLLCFVQLLWFRTAAFSCTTTLSWASTIVNQLLCFHILDTLQFHNHDAVASSLIWVNMLVDM